MGEIDTDRWRRLRPLLDHAIELDEPARTAWLETLRAEHRDISSDVEKLLAEYEALESRALPTAMRLVVNAIGRDGDA